MDLELLRTFLEVSRTRHFALAARNLFVTQAAVSARIRSLEDIVGSKLFTRNRNNIQLTLAGHRLLAHAETIINTWNRALLETGAEDESKSLIGLGCLPSLWETYLTHWLPRIHQQAPSVLLQIELLSSPNLVPRVREQSLTLGLLYEPPQASDLVADHITDVELALVSTTANLAVSANLPNYVYVDWGTSFALSHSALVPSSSAPVLRVDTASLALSFLLDQGGSAYLPKPMISSELKTGQLHYVAGAKSFDRSVYLIRSTGTPVSDAITAVAESLHALV